MSLDFEIVKTDAGFWQVWSPDAMAGVILASGVSREIAISKCIESLCNTAAELAENERRRREMILTPEEMAGLMKCASGDAAKVDGRIRAALVGKGLVFCGRPTAAGRKHLANFAKNMQSIGICDGCGESKPLREINAAPAAGVCMCADCLSPDK